MAARMASTSPRNPGSWSWGSLCLARLSRVVTMELSGEPWQQDWSLSDWARRSESFCGLSTSFSELDVMGFYSVKGSVGLELFGTRKEWRWREREWMKNEVTEGVTFEGATCEVLGFCVGWVQYLITIVSH